MQVRFLPGLPGAVVARRIPTHEFLNGVALEVKKTLAANWILRVKVGDRRCDIGMGGYPTVNLEDARQNSEIRPMSDRPAARLA